MLNTRDGHNLGWNPTETVRAGSSLWYLIYHQKVL